MSETNILTKVYIKVSYKNKEYKKKIEGFLFLDGHLSTKKCDKYLEDNKDILSISDYDVVSFTIDKIIHLTDIIGIEINHIYEDKITTTPIIIEEERKKNTTTYTYKTTFIYPKNIKLKLYRDDELEELKQKIDKEYFLRKNKITKEEYTFYMEYNKDRKTEDKLKIEDIKTVFAKHKEKDVFKEQKNKIKEIIDKFI